VAKLDPESLLTGSFDRIKLGSGVVGKVTNGLLGLFALLVVIALGLKGDIPSLLLIAGIGVTVFLLFAIGVAIYAIKFPNLAALEGADLVRWRQMDMAAGDPKIIDGTANTLPPPEEPGGA
jgi:hypothetical protein